MPTSFQVNRAIKRLDELTVESDLLIKKMALATDTSYKRRKIKYVGPVYVLETEFFALRTKLLVFLETELPDTDFLQRQTNDLMELENKTSDAKRLAGVIRGLRDYYTNLVIADEEQDTTVTLIHDLSKAVENLAPPYPEGQLDLLEKRIKMVMLQVFGENSLHYEAINKIFNPRSTVVVGTSSDVKPTDEVLTQERNKMWDGNKQRILNSLNVMLEDYGLLKISEAKSYSKQDNSATVAETETQNSQSDNHQAFTAEERQADMYAAFLATALGLLAFLTMREFVIIEFFVNHPNRLPLEIGTSVTVALVLSGTFRAKWRKTIWAGILFPLLLVVLQLLGG